LVDLPSFFTRTDFWVTLLPGYIAILLGLFLLSNESFNKMLVAMEAGESLVSLFSAVVFIVAGPAIGLIIWQFYIHGVVLIWYLTGHRDKKYEFFREYSRLRSICEDKERTELDAVDAQYQFGISTGIAVLVIAIIYFLFYVSALLNYSENVILSIYYFDYEDCKHKVPEIEELKCALQKPPNLLLLFFLFLVPSISMVGSRFYDRGVRLPIICKLMKKYPSLQSTKICREIRPSRPEAIISINKQIIMPDETKSIMPGETITLDSNHSYDHNNKPLDYTWKKIDGPKVILNGKESPPSLEIKSEKLTIRIPSSMIIGATYSFELIVKNHKEMSKPKTINFLVTAGDRLT